MSKESIIGRNAKDEFLKLFKEFMDEDELISKEFWKYFQHKTATKQIPVPEIEKAVDAGTHYNSINEIDCRLLLTLIHPEDKRLAIDVIKFVGERYMNKPASDLTLRQFKMDLTRRLLQVGF